MSAKELLEEADRLSSTGETADAEKLYGELIDTFESSSSVDERRLVALAYNNRGQLKYRRVDFDEAIVDYSHAIEVDGSLAVPYYNRGQVHYRVGRHRQGVGDLKKALELQPDFEDARLNLEQAEKDLRFQNEHGQSAGSC